jgi:hypothetical protein
MSCGPDFATRFVATAIDHATGPTRPLQLHFEEFA